MRDVTLLLLIGLVCGWHANAQTTTTPRYVPRHECLPDPTAGSRLTYNHVGVCLRWSCPVENKVQWSYTMCGTWAELAKVPGRVLTIKRAADPLASLNSAGNRFTIVPLDHPSMQGMPK